MAMLQVHAPEPLERAVLRHDLHQRLQRRIVLPVVAGLVGVGNHHHIGRIVVAAQALVECRERAVFVPGDALAALRGAKQHVVMAALDVLDRPLVAQKGNEAVAGIALHVVLQHVPLEIVHPDVVLGVRHVVQPGIVPGPDHESIRRADALGETRMAVGVAPVDAPCRLFFDQYRIGAPGDGAVLGPERETVDAGRI